MATTTALIIRTHFNLQQKNTPNCPVKSREDRGGGGGGGGSSPGWVGRQLSSLPGIDFPDDDPGELSAEEVEEEGEDGEHLEEEEQPRHRSQNVTGQKVIEKILKKES